jgi:phosphoribosylaminoimidazolecarboxamide formyltransferase/IMP cyclohydrolase
MSTNAQAPPPGAVTVRRALLSVSDKAGLVPFAQALHARGVTLLSTGGTAKALADAGLPVVNVADVTAFPEMLDGRVKTLHPAVHGGILARRHRADDLEAIGAHGIQPIDLVVVNLYPFARAAANPSTRFDALIEEIDIGGPSMVRAAAKNFRDVLIVVDPADYPRVLEDIAAPAGSSPAFRFDLARRAFAHTAAYDATIASALEAIGREEDPFARPADAPSLPATMRLTLPRRRLLRYGENPHQAAAWYGVEPAEGFGAVAIKQGKELSYTNLLDLDAAARIALEFDEPAAAVIKHANPCGVATGATIAGAYVTARDADPLSAFGGIIGLNRPLDAETAQAITSTFMEAVIAPAVDDDARAILARKPNLRVLTADFAAFRDAARPGVELRSILGGMLAQERDRVIEARATWPDAAGEALKVVTKRPPSLEEWQALRFAWRVCAHVKSNTILFADVDRTRAVGAGQMSRVDAVKVAVMKAGGSVIGSVVASDAFFPFRDGLDAVAAGGATAVVQPGGSVRDAEVIAAADEHGLAMVFTGRRHFRH